MTQTFQAAQASLSSRLKPDSLTFQLLTTQDVITHLTVSFASSQRCKLMFPECQETEILVDFSAFT